MNRIVNHFLKPLTESRGPKIDFVSEDDLEFLRVIGEYMYHKRTDKRSALEELDKALTTASRRSELYNEIRQASQNRLSNTRSLYAEVDVSNMNEEDIGGLINSSSQWDSNIISGSVDDALLEGARAIGITEFNNDDTLVYVPVLERWLASYMETSEHSIAVSSFLESVHDALLLDQTQEVIARHSPNRKGIITHAK